MLKHKKDIDENLIISESDLTAGFFAGCKEVGSAKNIGVELEKLPVLKSSLKAAPYKDVSGFLKRFKKSLSMGKWDGVFENDSLLGLCGDAGTISLEPGSQTEISLKPIEKIAEIKQFLDVYNKTSREIGEESGILWLGYGIQPVSTHRNINIIPKKRYECMTHYLPTTAKKPLVMMRETSGIQASFDYVSEEDAMKKFEVALRLSPFISAAFANSPVRGGRLTKYKSYRASSWLETDNDRCGLVSPKVFGGGFSFADYAQTLLDVPMIFIERKLNGVKTALRTDKLTFRQFLKQGYQGFFPTKNDWETHLSLYFPDVRLKNYIEIRNHDNQRSPLVPAVSAFWKGIVYNDSALDAVSEVLRGFTYFDLEKIRHDSPVFGLDMRAKTGGGDYPLKDIVKEVFGISRESLKSFGDGEEVFLDEMICLVEQGMTPADVIVQKWENEWRADVRRLVEYSRV